LLDFRRGLALAVEIEVDVTIALMQHAGTTVKPAGRFGKQRLLPLGCQRSHDVLSHTERSASSIREFWFSCSIEMVKYGSIWVD
jgi:hypothetical protein